MAPSIETLIFRALTRGEFGIAAPVCRWRAPSPVLCGVGPRKPSFVAVGARGGPCFRFSPHRAQAVVPAGVARTEPREVVP